MRNLWFRQRTRRTRISRAVLPHTIEDLSFVHQHGDESPCSQKLSSTGSSSVTCGASTGPHTTGMCSTSMASTCTRIQQNPRKPRQPHHQSPSSRLAAIGDPLDGHAPTPLTFDVIYYACLLSFFWIPFFSPPSLLPPIYVPDLACANAKIWSSLLSWQPLHACTRNFYDSFLLFHQISRII